MTQDVQYLTAPYAPSTNLLAILDFTRRGKLPEQVTTSLLLQEVGIPEGSTPRGLIALKFLGLTDEANRPTSSWMQLRNAKDDEEYRSILYDLVMKAYAPVFERLTNPMPVSSPTEAFEGYEPAAQRSRMVTAFVSLCGEAGIDLDLDHLRGASSRQVSMLDHMREGSPDRPRPVRTESGRFVNRNPSVHGSGTSTIVMSPNTQAVDYTLLDSFLKQLPLDGKWTSRQRNKWMQAVTASIDLLIDVTDEVE